MRRLLVPTRPDPLARALLALAAAGVFVAGLQHARLFHRGYAEVEIVGPLFLMNAIGSLLVVLALVFRRIWIFVLGALGICVPSLASIAASHSSIGFLGFREGGYEADALVIVAAEIAVVVFALGGAAAALRGGAARDAGDGALRLPVAVVVVVAMGCAVLGIGMGSADAEREVAPGAASIEGARARIAAAGEGGRRGRELFADEGCDRCHSIAAIGANGKLGPCLDTLEDDLDDNLESIAEPRDDIADGYPEKLMPGDYARRLDETELRALARLVTAASGGDDEGADDNRGRGRRRGEG